jgi:hypothetical protein
VLSDKKNNENALDGIKEKVLLTRFAPYVVSSLRDSPKED